MIGPGIVGLLGVIALVYAGVRYGSVRLFLRGARPLGRGQLSLDRPSRTQARPMKPQTTTEIWRHFSQQPVIRN